MSPLLELLQNPILRYGGLLIVGDLVLKRLGVVRGESGLYEVKPKPVEPETPGMKIHETEPK